MADNQGLPMTPKWDPEKLQQDVQQLEELQSKPLIPKTMGYIKRCGPGLLQSAMTLGAGSAAASVAAGAAFGYKLLWVQPLAMFFGVCMLAALSNVVLTTQERPYKAFGRETSKILVFLWALGTIMASIIWHFPQYALCSGAIRDLYEFSTNTQLAPVLYENGKAVLDSAGKEVHNYTPLWYIVGLATGITVLFINIFTVWSYGSSAKGVKLYERFLQCTIALVIISFGIVVCCNFTKLNWLEVFRGFTGYYAKDVLCPNGSFNAHSLTMVLGMLGAAVGINMTFLYPYSQLAKGWGPAHKTLAKWDLGMTMFLPFTLVTSLIILAMTVGGVTVEPDKVSTMQPLTASKALVDILGPTGRVIFDLGLFGMTCGAVSTHMVVCGFTICEMFGLEYTKWRFRLFALVPAVGMFGVLVNLPFWLPIMASAVCLTMLPIAYLLFVIMNNKRSYIGDAVGKGWKRWVFNAILIIALGFTVIASCIKINNDVIKKIKAKLDKPAAAATDAASEQAAPAAEEPAATEETPAVEATPIDDVGPIEEAAPIEEPDPEAVPEEQSPVE